ncbi:hypothetical protein GY45DRAFT_193052 [Cubamyces sp. BRFM 1775]|nr:hypothetical protein GY45DRAFT_193052 [Cubamyces sp. BRFM 1775]
MNILNLYGGCQIALLPSSQGQAPYGLETRSGAWHCCHPTAVQRRSHTSLLLGRGRVQLHTRVLVSTYCYALVALQWSLSIVSMQRHAIWR